MKQPPPPLDISKETTQEEQHEEEEDCPLCCETMTRADTIYQLQCPTPTCQFNFCYSCIDGMLTAERCGYEQASDGSHQVKISLQCPQCRSKYCRGSGGGSSSSSPTQAANPSPSSKSSSSSKYPPEMILQSVLLLRRAYTLQDAYTTSDSELSATVLARKRDFAQTVTLEQLQDAHRRLHVYLAEIGKKKTNKGTNTAAADSTDHSILPLDVRVWEKVLLLNPSTDSSNSSGGGGGGGQQQQQRRENDSNNKDNDKSKSSSLLDPTLLQGLDELMSTPEQEFVTSLFLSGDTDKLVQGAHIMHGILLMPDQAALTVQRLSSFGGSGAGGSTSSNNNHNNRHQYHHQHTKKQLERIARTRKRFPLPLHMPRCVAWPVTKKLNLAQDKKKKKQQEQQQDDSDNNTRLQFGAVRGTAGRLGLRKGDIITHVQGEPVQDEAGFDHAMEQCRASSSAASGSGDGHPADVTALIVVNANEQTAKALVERASKMKQQGLL